MNCDTIKEGTPVIVEVDEVNKNSLALVYWKEKTKWWHTHRLLQPFARILRTSQFGIIYPKDTSKFKEGDKVKISIKVEKIEERKE